MRVDATDEGTVTFLANFFQGGEEESVLAALASGGLFFTLSIASRCGGAGRRGADRPRRRERRSGSVSTSERSGAVKNTAEEPGQEGQQLLRTADVLRAAGITHQVLYRYMTIGLIEAADSTETGQRLFHPDVVTLIGLIKSLNSSGYSLRDMKEIFFKDKRVRRAVGAKTSRAKN